MNIRQKFMISFGILLTVLVICGIYMLRQVDQLGRTVDVILRENYQSVIICQDVTESLERIDSMLLFSFTEERREDKAFVQLMRDVDEGWAREMQNLTVPTEDIRAHAVRGQLDQYFDVIRRMNVPEATVRQRQQLYRKEAYPQMLALKKAIREILVLNQNNMTEANNLARAQADSLFRQGIGLLVGCLAFLGIFSWVLVNWIQNPLRKLIGMTNEIASGNLALSLNSRSNDEIGQLARSFNQMAIALRGARTQLEGKLHRQQRLNRDVFEELPSPIALFDSQSRTVELATESARTYFDLREGRRLEEFTFPWLKGLFEQVQRTGIVAQAEGKAGMIQHFMNGQEYFFQPTAVPLPAGASPEELTGVVVILKDVTQAHEQQELKRSVISTVSHQLKTPLTSLQMSIYLLLEERCGELNGDQMDLVMAMRDDSRRLTDIIGDLLDLNRAEKSALPLAQSCDVTEFLYSTKERFQAECQDHEIELELEIGDGLAPVAAVPDRIRYVFDNLVGNAIRFTHPGGRITLAVQGDKETMRFSVTDTGSGISADVLPHVFEAFYRGPGQNSATGVGLGLSIVKEIISAHGGDIHVQSEEGHGTSFVFTLPVFKSTKGGH